MAQVSGSNLESLIYMQVLTMPPYFTHMYKHILQDSCEYRHNTLYFIRVLMPPYTTWNLGYLLLIQILICIAVVMLNGKKRM